MEAQERPLGFELGKVCHLVITCDGGRQGGHRELGGKEVCVSKVQQNGRKHHVMKSAKSHRHLAHGSDSAQRSLSDGYTASEN